MSQRKSNVPGKIALAIAALVCSIVFIDLLLTKPVIAADWADCFRYEIFANKVKRGQTIELLIRKHNGVMNNDL